MSQATHTVEDEAFVRRISQARGYSVKEIASRLFYDLLMGLVPDGFEGRALQLYHAAEALRTTEEHRT
jgi:hypothetical protein